MIKRPTTVDLFSGCGGMSLGFEAAGFDIVASVEIDPIHSLVHHVNFPYTATICQDIRLLTKNHIEGKLAAKGFSNQIDVLIGGPPCQGFSLMGKRVLEDPRNRLVFEFLRIVKELNPSYFIFENVPGIATGKHRLFLQELMEEFATIGYSVVQPVQVLNAASFGVPQKRQRLIIIGYKQGIKAPIYPQITHLDDHFTATKQAIGDLEKFEAFVGKDSGIKANTQKYAGFLSSYDFNPQGIYSLCHIRAIDKIIWGHIGSKHTEVSIGRFAATPPGKTEKTSRFFKLHPDQPCNTLRAGTASDRGAYTAPRPIHYQLPRCITVREAARLHGFPDWFQFHRTIWHGFREIGNAVSPMFAKYIADEILNCLGVDKKNVSQKILEPVDLSLLNYNMADAAKYWGVPNDIIPKRKR